MSACQTSTPRAKPSARPASPRASPRVSPAASSAKPAVSSDKKPKARKPKLAPPTAPMTIKDLGVPIHNTSDLSEDQAKKELEALQKKYGALIVTFNNQQAELQASQKHCASLEAELALHKEKGESSGTSGAGDSQLEEQLRITLQDLRAVEAVNMGLQKRINQLQVEHVSEEEVDQLFYALEVKEKQLLSASREKESLEQEVNTFRQLTARTPQSEQPKYIEIHHHNSLSEDDSDSDEQQ